MICTLIVRTDGQKEIQYGEQHLAHSRWIEYYTYKNLSEEQIKRIRDAKAEEIQAILNEIV